MHSLGSLMLIRKKLSRLIIVMYLSVIGLVFEKMALVITETLLHCLGNFDKHVIDYEMVTFRYCLLF